MFLSKINASTSNMGHENSFTFVRWFAAGLVLYGHSFVFLGLPEPVFMQWITLGPLGVYIFFSISGYLVAQSWENDPHVLRFLLRRILRIFPGLAICIFISAVFIGPMVTRLSLSDYFSHPQFSGYFTNVFLKINFSLPAVFEKNKFPHAVNGSLWSLPVEFFMYLVLAVWSRIVAPKIGYLIAALVFLFLALNWAMSKQEMLVFYNTDMRQVAICGAYFWVGALFQKIKIANIFSISSLSITLIIWVCLTVDMKLFIAFSYFCIPLFFLALGDAYHPILSKINNYDFSYGIYIYSFPIQQVIANFYPNMWIVEYIFWTIVFSVGVGSVSWYLIEKPALKLKPIKRN